MTDHGGRYYLSTLGSVTHTWSCTRIQYWTTRYIRLGMTFRSAVRAVYVLPPPWVTVCSTRSHGFRGVPTMSVTMTRLNVCVQGKR